VLVEVLLSVWVISRPERCIPGSVNTKFQLLGPMTRSPSTVLTTTRPELERLVVGCHGCGSRSRWWTAAPFAQQQQQGYGSERDQHHQLEISM
jgi:hypothetical protein